MQCRFYHCGNSLCPVCFPEAFAAHCVFLILALVMSVHLFELD